MSFKTNCSDEFSKLRAVSRPPCLGLKSHTHIKAGSIVENLDALDHTVGNTLKTTAGAAGDTVNKMIDAIGNLFHYQGGVSA